LYGIGDNLITARLPVLVRPSPPRFINYGDSFDLPIVVQNLTEQDLLVNIAIKATNADFGDNHSTECGFSATIGTTGRKLFTFKVNARLPGQAKFVVCCVAGKYGDASEIIIPVLPPPLTEAYL
jgi:uncharacterized protein YfaS (alpha-2-macroglobulin family)